MFVYFANTDGVLFAPDTINDFTVELGAVSCLSNGIVIVDRRPLAETTELLPEDIVKIIHMLHQNIYTNQPITIYLPRIEIRMFDEAEIQKHLLKLSDNVSLIPV